MKINNIIDIKKLEAYIKKEFGEKCPDYSLGCFGCAVYRLLKDIKSFYDFCEDCEKSEEKNERN